MDPSEIPLRDIHLPDPVSWWPPAPGWWLAVGAIVATTLLALLVWRVRRRRRVQRAALNELTQIESDYREHADTHRLAQELSRLTRRTALALDPARASAATTGAGWTAYLDELNANGTTDERIKIALTRAPYRPLEILDGDALVATFRPWLAGLRAPSTSGK